MTTPMLEFDVHVAPQARGRKALRPGKAPPRPPGRVPRVARLMALAIHFDGLIRDGLVANYADLAALGQVTRARVTQVMNLLHLAPDIQEAILFLPLTTAGRKPPSAKPTLRQDVSSRPPTRTSPAKPPSDLEPPPRLIRVAPAVQAPTPDQAGTTSSHHTSPNG